MAKKLKEVKIKNDNTAIAKDLTLKLMELMGIVAGVEVGSDKENDAILVDIKSDNETGLLIGNRGRTLNSIQTLLGMMLRQKTGIWQRVIVNVADWRDREKEWLKQLASQAAEKVKETGEPQYLYNLTPSQRRTIHLILSEDEEVKTESQGEGSNRFLMVTSAK